MVENCAIAIFGGGPVCTVRLTADGIFEILSNGIKWSLLASVTASKEVKILIIIDHFRTLKLMKNAMSLVFL